MEPLSETCKRAYAILKAAVQPPSSDSVRRAEHALVLAAALGLGVGAVAWIQREGWSALVRKITGAALSAVRSLPGGAAALDSAFDSALKSVADEIAPPDPTALVVLPATGTSGSALEAEIRRLCAADFEASRFVTTAQFGGIYHHPGGGTDAGAAGTAAGSPSAAAAPGDELASLQRAVASAFLNTNALYPGLFRAARKFEAEAVAMAVSMLKGKGLAIHGAAGAAGAAEGGADPAPGACGLLTSGGTESIICAFKALRDSALGRLGFGGSDVGVAEAAQKGIVLRVLAGTTAHPALDKACGLLGLRLVKLPVSAATQALEAAAVAAALDPHTLAVYTSCPTFPHGVVDPIPEITAAARGYTRSAAWGAGGVPVHVDCCLGGVLVSFLHAAQRAAGGAPSPLAPIPDFDFRVPGVATISCDLHKYGGAPKGASIVAFATPDLRRCAYTSVPSYPGGLYATPTLAGSRSGAPGALAWATLVHTGSAGYAAMAAEVAAIHARLARAVAATPGLQLLGASGASILAFTTTPGAAFSPYALAARMEERGWHLSLLQGPPGLHIPITERLSLPGLVDRWVADLRECAVAAAAAPADPKFEGKGAAGIYGASAVLPAEEVGGILARYCDVLYLVRKE